MSPRQMDEMSLWEFAAYLDGWKLMNNQGKKEEVDATPEDLERMGIGEKRKVKR